MAEDVHLVQTQRFADLRHLLHELFNAPQGRVSGRLGMARTQLVVEDDRALITQRSQWLEVIGGRSRPTVKHQERRRLTAPDYAIPYLPARYVDVTLAGRESTIGLARHQEDGDPGSCYRNHGHPCAHNQLSC
jgi:hypothetical protein